ncbi:hypothetical protein HOC96_00030 [archaeon]|jgi:hypothetical protein|nr:hypothetical protein [archaeon]
MQRSIIKMSDRSHGITLPRQWLNDHDLSKGDTVGLEILDNCLHVSSPNFKKDADPKTVSFDLRGCNKSAIEDALTAPYRFGYDKIILKFDEKCIDVWDNHKEIETREVIQNKCLQLLGFECLELNKTSAIVRGIMEVTSKEFDLLLQRLFLLTYMSAKDIHTALKDKDQDKVRFIISQFYDMGKYERYCLRFLNKIGKGKNTALYTHLISKLGLARSALLYVVKLKEDTNIKEEYSKQVLDLIKEAADLIKEVHTNYKNFSIKRQSELLAKRQNLMQQMFRFSEGKNRADAIVSQRLLYVMSSVSWIMNMSLAMSLEGN